MGTEIKVTVCQDTHDTIRQGFFYRPPIYRPLNINEAVVNLKGTQAGKPTVDFILEDEKGQKYVIILTSTILAAISAIQG